ncbi:MAG: RidA family protein [Pseudomonadota bacterium]
MKSLLPHTIAPPFARYAHGAISDPGARVLVTSGQLGLAADGTIPDDTQAQAEICFANIDAILREGGATRQDVLRINAFVTDRAHMAGYMAARDEWLAEVTTLPASTLVIVSGFTRPEFTVEIEVTAQVPEPK